MGGKSDAPDPPNYAAAAQETAKGNLEATRAATAANRVNQYTPYGNLVYNQTPTNGPDGKLNPDAGWSSTVNLSPTGKLLLDQQNRTSLGLGALQDTATRRVAGMQSQPFDYSSVGDVQKAAEKAVTDRLDPMWAERDQVQRSTLANQGLQPGTEAYDNAMRSFNNAKNDAYGQAVQAGINTMPQTYQMASALRNQPLNELNALRTGSQVSNPTFQNTPQQATTSGADMLGAANSQYGGQLDAFNTKVGQQNSYNQGLMTLAALAMFSDRRLKSNIRLIGRRKGYNWYEYDIFGRREQGVMAQEVMLTNPGAVIQTPSGYYAVNYGAL